MIGKEMSCGYTGGLRESVSQCPQKKYTISELENNVCFEFRNTTKNILEKTD